MDTEGGIILGRPYGGVGILWRKSLSEKCVIKSYECDRITGIEITIGSFHALFLCVYFPCDNSDNFDEYCHYLSMVKQITVDFPTPYVFIMGDFNANLSRSSRFGDELVSYCERYSLHISDNIILPSDTFTHVSMAHGSTSWLDHCVTTVSGHDIITDLSILFGYVSSDHLPLSVQIQVSSGVSYPRVDSSTKPGNNKMYKWCDATVSNLIKYKDHTRRELCKIRVPTDAINCKDRNCVNHKADIDRFYNDIVNSLNMCVKECIPCHNISTEYNVPGWNDIVKEGHEAARDAFLWWKVNNKPRHGPIYDDMKLTRARFKYALRSCKRNEDAIKCDQLASHMSELNMIDFWKQIKHMSTSKSVRSNTIDGVTGDGNIAEKWKCHYENIFNSIKNVSMKDSVLHDVQLYNAIFNMSDVSLVTANEIAALIKDLKKGKSAGPDGLTSECLIHANFNLSILLSLCFNSMLVHGYMPDLLLDSVIIPLVKNKCASLSDMNNYRPIAIANVISKVLEGVLLNRIDDYLWTNDNQFGFKAGHATDKAVYLLHEFIDHFRSQSTTVYVTFLDASKAFDKINHWTLFRKLIDRGIPIYIVDILMYWYRNQTMVVRWGNMTSTKFCISNGVKQGGILSPRLFNVYVNDLSILLNDTKLGGSIDNTLLNHILYADDLCLLSLSTSAMQQLLTICDSYGVQNDILFNPNKSMCMSFKPKGLKTSEPIMSLSGNALKFVVKAKYLGVWFENDKTNADCSRQLRRMYAQTNSLLRNFHRCSPDVKCMLFKTYCTTMYCSPLWFKTNVITRNKLRVAYNNSLRRLLYIPKRTSASEMFVCLNIPSFGELMRKNVYNFMRRLITCTNCFISSVVTSTVPLHSSIWKWWHSILHV